MWQSRLVENMLLLSCENSVWLNDLRVDPIVTYDLIGHTQKIISAKFSYDGKYIATTADDNTIRIWNTHEYKSPPTLEKVIHTLKKPSVAFSHNSQRMLVGSHGSLNLYELSNLSQAPLFLDKARVHAVYFSPNDQYLIAAELVFTKVWDLAQKNNQKKFLANKFVFNGDVQFISSTANGKLLHGTYQVLMLHEYANGFTISKKIIFNTNVEQVINALINATGEYVLIATNKVGVCLKKVADNTIVKVAPVSKTGAIAFCPTGCHAVIGTDAGDVLYYDLTTSPITLQTITGHTSAITSVAMCIGGDHIIAGAADGTARIWRVA